MTQDSCCRAGSCRQSLPGVARGNDFKVTARVSLYDEGTGKLSPLDLTSAEGVAMAVVGRFSRTEGAGVSVEGSRVTASFPWSLPCGAYGVEITFRDAAGRGRVFERAVFEVVDSVSDVSAAASEGDRQVAVDISVRTVYIGKGTEASDYPSLSDKPKINGVELVGDRTSAELGLASAGDIPERVSQLDNDAGYLTGGRLRTVNGESLVGEGDIKIEGGGGASVTVDAELSDSSENPVQNKVVKAAIDAKQDKGDYALKSEIPDVSGLAQKTDIPDISGKADKSEIPDVSGFATKAEVSRVEGQAATNAADLLNKVDKVDGKGLSANDLTDERAAKVDKVTLDGSPNEYLNGEGGYSRPVRQGYGVTVDPDGTVHADPQVVARQSDVAAVAAALAAQEAKEQGDVDSLAGRIADEESGRAAAVAALQALIDGADGRISGIEALDERIKMLLGYSAARSVVNLTAGAAGKYVQCASRSAVANPAFAISKPFDVDACSELFIKTGFHPSDAEHKPLDLSVIAIYEEIERQRTVQKKNDGGDPLYYAVTTDPETGSVTVTQDETTEDTGYPVYTTETYTETRYLPNNEDRFVRIPDSGYYVASIPQSCKVVVSYKPGVSDTAVIVEKHGALANLVAQVFGIYEHRTMVEAMVSLAVRVTALEDGKSLLGDATAGTLDVSELTRNLYPVVMRGRGVPAEANIPENLPEGLPWDGVPAFAGQFYVNVDAASGGLYYAVGVNSVNDWKQV